MSKLEESEIDVLKKEVEKLKSKIIRDERKGLKNEIESQRALLDDSRIVTASIQKSLGRSKSISNVIMFALVICITTIAVSGYDSMMENIREINLAKAQSPIQDVEVVPVQSSNMEIPRTVWEPMDEVEDEALAESILEALDLNDGEKKKVSQAELRGFGADIDPNEMIAALESGDSDRIDRAMLGIRE